MRRAPRFPVKLRAELFRAHAPPVGITIVDISRDGLGIELPMRLEAGQAIALATESVFVFAAVRHCRESGVLFRAGLAMLHLFEKRVVAPEDRGGSRFLGTTWGKRFHKKGAGALHG
jgi:hypothetical protein